MPVQINQRKVSFPYGKEGFPRMLQILGLQALLLGELPCCVGRAAQGEGKRENNSYRGNVHSILIHLLF